MGERLRPQGMHEAKKADDNLCQALSAVGLVRLLTPSD